MTVHLPTGQPSRTIRVLFLAHGAERTGPPVLLLRLCRWLREHSPLDMEFVLLEGGPLLDEFAELGRVWVIADLLGSPTRHVVASGLHRMGVWGNTRAIQRAGAPRRLRAIAPPDLVYVNTAGSVHALRYLDVDGVRVLTHLHELAVGLEHFLRPTDLELLLERSDHVLVVSEAVYHYAHRTLGIAPASMDLCPGFVDQLPPLQAPAPPAVPWPDGSLVVGACGSTGWRKGPDLLLTIAAELRRQRPDLDPHFAWVGGATGEGSTEGAVRADATTLGLEHRFHFIGAVDDPTPWFGAIDVFALPSREDAFPLVGLEAAAAGVPIVCFDRGGLPELVRSGSCGTVVAFPDIHAFAQALAHYLGDEDARTGHGIAGRRHVATHHVTNVRAPGVLELIQRLAARPPTTGPRQ